jgi:predicted nucleic acid-binding protein
MIGLDSWIFLEYFVLGQKYKKCKNIILSKKTKIISVAAIMEIKYKGTKIAGKIKTKRFLNDIKINPSVKIINVDTKIAERAANLRLKYYNKGKKLSYSDCIHLATAILSKCKKFYSGDPDFEGIREIPIEVV